MTTVRAITCETYGAADVLALTEVACPAPRDNEVPLGVHAAGLDRRALHMMTGRPYLGRRPVRAGRLLQLIPLLIGVALVMRSEVR